MKLSQDEFVAITGLLKRRNRPFRLVLLLAVGIACLFWSYTLVLGILLLIFACVALVMPLSIPAGTASTYRASPHLHGELIYRVTDRDLSVTGADFDCQCSWKNLAVWQERDGWVVLSPHGMPRLLLSTQLLRQADVYDSVLELAREHAREFDT